MFKNDVEKIYDEIVEIRRDIHMHPEIGRNEVRTSQLIRDKLKEYGVDSIDSPVPTAVIGLIRGSKGPGKCVALRADIDALPVTEQTGLSYSSQTEGMMHACGHDMHCAMLLGTAKILCDNRDKFSGCVKLIFQHSEDTLPGGAKELVEKGVLKNPTVDAIFGLHNFPDDCRSGEIGIHKGPLTTSVDLYEFTVNGQGGHGSSPHKTKDPVLAMCQLVIALQQIQSRFIDAKESVVFPIATVSAGEAVNIIPSQAKCTGIARAFKEDVRKQVKEHTTQIVKGIEIMTGCTVDINHYEGYPSCYNDEDLCELTLNALRENLEGGTVFEDENPMPFSEDFSYFTQTGVPGCYMMLFSGHQGEKAYELHNPKYAAREDSMKTGMEAMATAAVNFLNK